ncbi:MAG: D-alanine--D-alanine ligase [Gammaproteobacteria bacterium]|nr:D-alanine--D-alanine ligase [Gammaproteobacteria bacterium]
MNKLSGKNIGVLCGGWSDERPVSLDSGKSAHESLLGNNLNTFIFDFQYDDIDLLSKFIKSNNIDLVLNLIHGSGGEDGLVQSYLDRLSIKYVGSNSKSSKLSFNKVHTKEIWLRNKLKTPNYLKLSDNISSKDIKEMFDEKFILKPCESGSSVGIKIFDSANFYSSSCTDILKKLSLNSANAHEYFIEEFITAPEYTAPIINNEVFPIIKIETKREFYNYEAKYLDNDTIFSFPEFSEDVRENINLICMKAFNSMGCSNWGRVDFFMDKDSSINLIEINSIPGMTDHSLVPKSAKENGFSYDQLLLLLLEY